MMAYLIHFYPSGLTTLKGKLPLEFTVVQILSIWRWLKRHKLVWYQYMLHVDYGIEILRILTTWITHLTKPYLQLNDAEYMELSTICGSWKKHINKMMKRIVLTSIILRRQSKMEHP
jgi:hypothetical protein